VSILPVMNLGELFYTKGRTATVSFYTRANLKWCSYHSWTYSRSQNILKKSGRTFEVASELWHNMLTIDMRSSTRMTAKYFNQIINNIDTMLNVL